MHTGPVRQEARGVHRHNHNGWLQTRGYHCRCYKVLVLEQINSAALDTLDRQTYTHPYLDLEQNFQATEDGREGLC